MNPNRVLEGAGMTDNGSASGNQEAPGGAPIPPVEPVGQGGHGAATPSNVATATKPDVGKRAIAWIIDGVIAGILSSIPFLGSLLGAAYILTRDGFEFDFMDGRSLGKKLMKLRPVRDDGGKMDLTTSIKRNWPLAIGMLGAVASYAPLLGMFGLTLLLSLVGAIFGLVEIYFVLTSPDGRRYGDKFAGTHVVETQN